MDACTENYECLVLDNTSKSNKITDCVFWYKAPIRRGFRVGAPIFWQAHSKLYDPKHVTTGTGAQTAQALVRSRGAPTITVKKRA
jgi:hypothetical protein